MGTLAINKTRSKFLFFGEERFKVKDYGVDGLNDPFVDPGDKYIIHENTGGGIMGVMSVVAGYAHQKLAENPMKNDRVKERWGTSTGAIIEAYLTKYNDYKGLLDFYVEDGPVVFDERFLGSITAGGIYSAKKLEDKLKKLFGDITMKELYEETGVKLYIVAYEAIKKKTIIFNRDDYYGQDTSYVPVWVAVRASMSAPYYFGTFFWNDPVTKETKAFLDGGITGFNMASGLAYDHATDDKGIKPEDIHILSIGTGREKNGTTKEKIKSLQGFLNVTQQLAVTVNALMTSQMNFTLRRLASYKKDKGLSFQRWDIDIPKDLDEMDNTDNIDEMFNLTVKSLSA